MSGGAVDLAKAVFETLVDGAVRRLTGKEDKEDLGDAVRDKIKEAVGRTEQLVEDEARKIVDQLGLVLAVRDLADDVAEVPKAFMPDGSVPDLNLDVTIVGPDESFETETKVAPVDDRFDPGDK